jgi:hypothetical protein
MAGGHMKRQRLRMHEFLVTRRALEREMAFMTLHMIMHSILILLDSRTDSADELTRLILLIGVWHV